MRITLFLLSCLGCFSVFSQNTFEWYNTALPFEQRVKSLVSQMTLEEKISQMQYLSKKIERLNIPAYNWWNEALHGVAYNGRATCFPQAIGMAATWDNELIFQVADIISTEGRAKFYDGQINQKPNHFGGLPGLTFWSPNINIFRDPRWGRGQETYGEDPFLTSRMAVSFIKGIQGNDKKYFKAIATPKHYAIHSGPEAIRHSFNAITSRRDLYETYLPAFEAGVKEGKAWSVMSAYNAYLGESCTASYFLLKETLRNEWGFNGYVVSDCSAIGDIYNNHKITSNKALACSMALKAGCDLDCGDEYKFLKEAYDKGYITDKDINTSVSRLMMARMKLGLFDDISAVPYSSIKPADYDKEESRKMARTMAQKSMVLLKNELLPLSKKKYKKIAVIGPYINREDIMLGNYHAVPSSTVTFLQGIVNAVGKERVLSAEGIVPWDNRPDKRGHPYDIAYHSDTTDAYKNKLHDKALDIAKKSNLIIAFMGISSSLEGEEMPTVKTTGFDRGDRTTIDLPEEQGKLLKELKATGKPVVLVLTSGSALAINWEKENIPSILQAWFPGEEGGNAAADVLFGNYNPAGRLPVTFYKSLSDLPPFENYFMENRTYRYFKGKPLFPFGYGLSYTKFDYSGLKLSKAAMGKSDSLTVELNVRNSGVYDGDEVVQLYIKNLSTKNPQPNKSLKGFKRISLKKGESKPVTFLIHARDVKYFDEREDAYIVEACQYEMQVGASSEDIRLKGTFDIK